MRISAEEVMKIVFKELEKVGICQPLQCFDFSLLTVDKNKEGFLEWGYKSGVLDGDNEWRCYICEEYHPLDCKFWITVNTILQKSYGQPVCETCIGEYNTKMGRMNQEEFEEFIALVNGKIMDKNQKLNKKIETKANPYLKFLPDNWAEAIVLNPENAESIISLWKGDWWKQYDEDDTLIQAILNDSLKENIAVELNRIRSDHPEAVQMCIDGKIDSQWLLDLMNAGFLGRDDAVQAVINGADPMFISKLDEGGDYDSKKMPPGL